MMSGFGQSLRGFMKNTQIIHVGGSMRELNREYTSYYDEICE